MAAADGTLYLYTSLTAGSSHIITATSRLETILKANKIPFRAIDVATDDAARKLWGRYSKGRKLPGLVKFRTIVGDLEQIEEWNEFGELKMEIGAATNPDDFSLDPTPANTSAKPPTPLETPSPAAVPASTPNPRSGSPHIQIQNPPVKPEATEDQRSLALRLAGEEAAAKAKENARSKLGSKPPTTEGDGQQPPTANPKAQGTEPVENVAAKVEEKDFGADKSTSPEGRRRSVAPEIIPPPKRPSLADECAAVSSANFRADNAEALGLINHHRGSAISATSKEEQDQVTRDIRSSISQAPDDGDIEALRKETTAAEEDTIEEDSDEEKAAEDEDKKDGEKKQAQAAEETTPQKQGPKDGEKAVSSVED